MTRSNVRFSAQLVALAALAAALAAALPAALSAQTATFAGAVVRDTLEHGISGARITLLGAGRSDTSDAKGEFKFTNLPAGKIAVMVRRVGFSPMVDTVDLVNGKSVEREYVMDAAPVTLDSMRVVAQRQEHFSAALSQFQEHLKAGKTSGSGHFITEDILAKNDSRALQDVISSYVPGLSVYQPYPRDRPSVEYLSSGRGGCSGPVFSCGGSNRCPVQLYINGLLRFPSAGGDVPDLTVIETNEIAGVEYYAGGAQTPLEYNSTSNGCGVLVLWLREQIRKP